jgi:glutamine amidotransferase
MRSMCRLAAYLGAPLTPAHIVFDGSDPLYEQSWAPQELLSGTVNADGYGVVWYAEGRPARLAKLRPIWYDTDLRSTLSSISSGCGLAGIRNGTPGHAA